MRRLEVPGRRAAVWPDKFAFNLKDTKVRGATELYMNPVDLCPVTFFRLSWALVLARTTLVKAKFCGLVSDVKAQFKGKFGNNAGEDFDDVSINVQFFDLVRHRGRR